MRRLLVFVLPIWIIAAIWFTVFDIMQIHLKDFFGKYRLTDIIP
ncbi:hypothetical protein [Candidatus Jettenia sp. AMX1]|nr:hypothetical protein [Candidatus Jettenia sp. AMX1]WKZ15148.1 MAG: hypothetical protein QY317_14735 [Candidatus Jettenia caeni]